MDKQNGSTNKIKDPEEESIEALTEEAREDLVKRGVLVPVTNGTIKHRIRTGFNRLFGAIRQR